MSTSEEAIEAKIQAIESRLWRRAWTKYRAKSAYSGERLEERYVGDGLNVSVVLEVFVYETSFYATRDNCTLGREGVHGYVGGRYERTYA